MTESSEPRTFTAGVESLGRIRLQGILLLVLAFLTGALAGGAVERMWSRGRWHPGMPRGRGEITYMRHGGQWPRIFDELNLTAEQHTQIQAILQRRRPLTDSILRASLPQLRAVIESTRAEVRQVLTPEQRAKLDRLYDRERSRHGDPWSFAPPLGPPGMPSESIAPRNLPPRAPR